MAYLRLNPSEHSSGAAIRCGAITKTGNTLARTCPVEAAWTYRFPARVSQIIRDRLMGLAGADPQHRLESASAALGALPKACRNRQAHTQSRRGDCARIGRLHLGDRPHGRTEVHLTGGTVSNNRQEGIGRQRLQAVHAHLENRLRRGAVEPERFLDATTVTRLSNRLQIAQDSSADRDTGAEDQ
jgi:Transposase IS116/IS110/IS902 family